MAINNITKTLKYTITLFITTFCFSCKDKVIADMTPSTNFEALWTILDTKYCYFEEKNIDWNGVKQVYEPRLSSIKTERAMFDLFAQMLDTLQDGHINLYSYFDISRCTGWFENYPTNFDNAIIFSDKYLGRDYKIAGGMYYQLISDNTVGYIRYSDFTNNFDAKNLYYIDKYFADCKGIIIDVRNNGGGSALLAENLAASFFSSKTLTGYIRHKTGSGHLDFSKPEAVYSDPCDAFVDWSNKRVAILINRRCYSATNAFVAKARYGKNVKLFGGITGGGGGFPMSSELPCGWMIRFSAVPMLDAKMNHTEFGIEPDVKVNQQSDDTTNGIDTIIETAVNWIKNS